MRIRDARPDDAGAIAHVHVASWRSTYRGLLPDALLESLSLDQREAMWRRQTEAIEQDPDRGVVLVLEDDTERIVGFAAGGPEREPDAGVSGELYAIYFLEEYQGRGHGRRLATEVVERLRRQGHGSMRVWVLEGNPAQAFYERLGGEREGEKPLEIGGEEYVEVAYAWRDLGRFG